MKKILMLLVGVLTTGQLLAADLVWYDGMQPVTYQLLGKHDPVVDVALKMFGSDMKQVTGKTPVADKKGTIVLCQLDRSKGQISRLRKQGVPVDSLRSAFDAFSIKVNAQEKQIIVAGSNGRGCAYGLLELSRMAGVSPWVWWGDVVPEPKSRLTIDERFQTLQAPSVTYRGVFLNDEDWSLRNWAWKNYDKSETFGRIGPKTYRAVFELLLRLRANVIWPAMHEGTTGFFTVAGNKEMADSCGILIGSSHCEPLLRNNVAEWNVKERGRYNYITNREQVMEYWQERLQQVKGSEELFTIGMRGIHDGSMEGVKTPNEKLEGLQQVIDDQRELIRRYYDKDVEKVPQVFIPYKEVLEIMESGLLVPDDVTLMWCDDNYGYMTRLSDAEQQKRQGGGGVYYHLSYWGRPHDYLWLTTTQPGLVYSEMKAAYDHNCRRLWIVNVHDPKVAAYDLELFMDMAWDIKSITPASPNLKKHLESWLCTQFGEEAGKRLAPAMQEYYRLCAIRKPEFMGWSQVELDRRVYPRGRSMAKDTEFSMTEFGGELQRYLSDFAAARNVVEEVEKTIPHRLKDAFFAHVKYPVCSAEAMARKMLEAQCSRQLVSGWVNDKNGKRYAQAQEASARSMLAYQEIVQLCDYYNNAMAGGKWKGAMTFIPRDLPVFYGPVVGALPAEWAGGSSGYSISSGSSGYSASSADFVARNACQFSKASEGCKTIEMLGHSMNAVAIPKGGELTFNFDTEQEGDAILYSAMIPTQPNDRGDLRYQLTLDDQQPVVISLKEKYRSEFWKLSVLRGQALKKTAVKMEKGRHTLKIKAIDDHIICDQWMIDFKADRKFYMIPVEKQDNF